MVTMVMSPRQQTSRPYIALGREVRRARDAAGMTQEELAERADISPSYVAAIETGTRPGTSRTLLKIAEVLGLRADHLLVLGKHLPPVKDGEAAVVVDSAEKAAILQRMAEWAAEELLDLERMGRIAFIKSRRPAAQEDSGDERPGDSNEDQTHP